MPEPSSKHTLYRVSLMFDDGDYTVDAWALSPDSAQGMAVIDARMLKPFTVRSGDLLRAHVEPVCDLRVEAFNVDAEFEAMLDPHYGVKIIERDKAPWEWCFRGTRPQLLQMLQDHWGSVDGVQITEVRGA